MKPNPDTRTFEEGAGYRVVPMNPAVKSRAGVLERALSEGLTAQKDPGREDFYWIRIDGTSYYFHVFATRRTAYLLSAKPAADGAGRARLPEPAGCHAC